MKRFLLMSMLLLAGSLMGICQQNQRPQRVMPSEMVYTQAFGSYSNRTVEGRSFNFAPTFLIYPDTKLTEQQAKALVDEMRVEEIGKASQGTFIVASPAGAKYDFAKDKEAFINIFNALRSGNLKLIGIGQGATFVNALMVESCGYVSGVATYNGKKASVKKGAYAGVPAYVAGKTAKSAAQEYEILNAAEKDYEPLLTVSQGQGEMSLDAFFKDAWDKTLKKAYRFNNYKHTHYEGCDYGQYGVYELEPFTIAEDLGIIRKDVVKQQRSGLPWLWYEYWPEELMDQSKVPAGSVPVMVLLHGNTNDPRTQAETSGFIEVQGRDRSFFVVEMEWQGSATAGAMGHDGVESTIYELLAKYPQLDGTRVYAEGLSAGSMTATALGIKKSHVFAAVGGHNGAIFGSAAISGISTSQPLWREATQKRGGVETAYISLLGTADNVVPFFTKDNYKGNSFLNAWNTYEQLNGMEVISDLDFSVDPLFGFRLQDRKTITTHKGAGIQMETGQIYKDGVPLIKIVAVKDYGHWNFKPTAQIMWDYFKQFSRDPKTLKLIYTKQSK